MATADQDLRDLLEAAGCETFAASGDVPERSFARLLAAGDEGWPAVDPITLRDGTSLACRRYPALGHTTLLLVHGAASHSGHWHTLARAVAEAGAASVVAVDMRGHGLSGERRGDEVAYADQLRDDLVDLVDALRADAGASRLIVGGHSAGGGLVLRAAADLETRGVDGYLLLAPFLGAASPATRPGLGGWVRLNTRRIKALTALGQVGVAALHRLPVMTFNLPLACRDGREPLSWSYLTMQAFGPRRGAADAQSIPPDRPVLLIAGGGDECFVAGQYDAALRPYLPHLDIRLVADVGHWDLLVDAEVIRDIAGWLSAFR
jgi:alpha-beta hydrolase superfamily lysophospholipase